MSLSWKQHPLLVPPSTAELARMKPDKVLELWELYHSSIANSERDPYRYGWKLDHWKRAEDLLREFNEILVSGGNRCLAGEQEVYDPVKKKKLRVDQITEPFNVYALDQTSGETVIASAEVPFRKPVQRLYRVHLANGQTLSCSAEHRVLTPSGWKAVGSLQVGSQIAASNLDRPQGDEKRECWQDRTESTSGTFQSVFVQDALHCYQTVQGFQGDCQSDCRSCDEQLPWEADGGQSSFPSQSCVPERISLCGNTFLSRLSCVSRLCERTLDVLGSKCEHILHRLQSGLRAILDVLRLPEVQSFDTGCHAFCTPYKSTLLLSEDQQFWLNGRQLAAGFVQHQCDSEYLQRDKQFVSDFSYSGNRVHYTTIVNVCFLRKDVVWDFTVPVYENYVAAGVYNHNSSKTTWAATAVVRSAVENPNSIIMCFAQNADVSIRQQQSAVYDALPEEMRKKTLGAEENVSYTRKNGFSKSSLILPGSRSHIIFKTYAQFLNNDTILEGAELGSREAQWINIGAWCDEYLIGPELLATLRFRLATRNAKLIVTFTPIDGYTEVVRDYLQGAATVELKEAELLGGRSVPFVQKSKNRNAGIIYFHSKDNPFGGYERIAADLRNRPEEEILTRAYGIPTKSASTRFPLFSREINVMQHDKMVLKDCTRYMILDPAGRKNWFMCWIAVNPSGTYYVYREWPDVNVGDWAKWYSGKWIGGEGSKGLGYGIRDYVDLIGRLEEGEEVFERLIDPRLGAAKYQTQNGASSIIEDLANAGLTFVPAPGLDIEDGIQAIQSKMAYNRKAPIDGANHPHFYISDRCENIITAFQEYTGDGGADEAWKDPIDCIRYACIDAIGYVDKNKATIKRGGGY